MELRAEPVLRSKRKAEIRAIYCAAFPKEERMPFPLMVGMSCLWNTDFLAFYDGEVLCGLAYLATVGKQSFLMFFAVKEELRSKGYGGRILERLRSLHPHHLRIVSIEPCRGEEAQLAQQLRRKAFYLRNGYRETGYFMRLAGQDQEILAENGVFRPRAFRGFFLLYSCCTMIPKIWKADGKDV